LVGTGLRAARRYKACPCKSEKELSQRRYVSPYNVVLVYAGLDDRDQTFSWLEKAYEERATWLILLNVDQLWDPLRSDARFKDLFQRMNLQPSNKDL
jgi:hypothetical protein